MSSPIITAIGCTIASWSSTVEPGIEGWTEHIRLDVAGGDTCEGLVITTADGSVLTGLSGRVSAARSDHGLGPERMIHDGVAVDGLGTWRVLTPELEAGDTARIDLDVRSEFVADYTWAPTPGVAYAELRRPRALGLTLSGLQEDKRFLFTANPGPGAQAVVQHPWMDRGAPPLPPPAGLSAEDARARLAGVPVVDRAWFGDAHEVGDDLFALGVADDLGWARTLAGLTAGGPSPVAPDAARAEVPAAVTSVGPAPTVSATLTLVFTTPHPRAELRPDRALLLQERRVLAWQDSEAARATFLALPDDVVGPVMTDARCHLRAVPGAAWVIAPAGVDSCTLDISHAIRDAWGPLPGGLVAGPSFATWTARDGTPRVEPLVIEGAAWSLPALDGAPLLSDRPRLWQELRERFADAAFPEPAIPLHAFPRGTAAWELAGALPGVLRDQVEIRDDLGVAPTRPRPLYRAREGGVVTSVEAAMIVTLYARQQKIDADWVLVRPASAGASGGVAPEGFTTALVRVTVDGQTRLLDPSCETCAPFTVRDTLHGAEAIGDGVDRIP